MDRRRFLESAMAGASALTAGSAGAQTAGFRTDESIGQVLRSRVAHEGKGLVAAVVQGDSVAWAGSGRRGVDDARPPDADTMFELGSLTKTFTALLLADMVVRRELTLDTPVQSVLPGGLALRDSLGQPITFGDLATQRSGLPRLPSNMRDPDGQDPYDYSRDDLLKFLAGWKPTRPRQQQWEYSNLGFGLLGEALAWRAGTRYPALLSERVLGPLRLQGLRLALRDVTVPGLMPGHDPQGRPAPLWRFDAMAGAGALAGTVRDIARYAQAAMGVFEHPLEAAFALALTPRGDGPSATNPTALAWLAGPLFQRRVFAHDGATAGHSSSLFIDPASRRAAIVLANAQVGVSDIALHLMDPRVPLRDPAAGKRLTERPAIAVAADAMAELAGTYALAATFKITVRVREGRLFAQATGQGEFELFAAEGRRWFARVTPLEVQFEGERGAAPAFVLVQSGQRLRFVRE